MYGFSFFHVMFISVCMLLFFFGDGTQIKYSREFTSDCLMRHSLQLEHRALRTVIARPRENEGFMLCFGCKVQCDGHEWLYVRAISQGTLKGLTERMFDSIDGTVVVDSAATNNEVARFNIGARSRSTDINELFQSFNEAVAVMSESTEFACIVYNNADQHVFSKSFGSILQNLNAETTLTAMVQQYLPQQQYCDVVDLLHEATLALKDQFQVINFIPAQCPLPSTSKHVRNKLSLPDAWHRFSPRSALVNNPQDIGAVMRAIEQTVKCKVAPRQGSQSRVDQNRKRDDILKKITRLSRTTRMLQMSSENDMQIEHDTVCKSPVTLFQHQMTSSGHIRVLSCSRESIDVLWNKFDPETSKF